MTADEPPPDLLYVDLTHEYSRLESWGVHLLTQISARLRQVLDIGGENSALNGASLYIPEGPHFFYDAAPELFLGRRGRGPLYVEVHPERWTGA